MPSSKTSPSKHGEAAGRAYASAWNSLRRGDAVRTLAWHICWMLGDNDWHRPIWQERRVPPDGRTFTTATFDAYLLRPAREGLEMPSLLMVHKLCEANAEHGARAITLLEQAIPDYQIRVKVDLAYVRDAQVTPVDTRQEAGAKGGRGKKAPDNVRSFYGNDASYLIRRLKRKAPEIAAALARGEYPSARAAALAAGIIQPPDPVAAIQRAYARLTPEQQRDIRKWMAELDDSAR
jgi:hypothetical protein